MEDYKKDIINNQIDRLEEIVKSLRNNFDVENDLAAEYTYLKLVREKLMEYSVK